MDDCPHFTFSRGNDLLEPRVREVTQFSPKRNREVPDEDNYIVRIERVT